MAHDNSAADQPGQISAISVAGSYLDWGPIVAGSAVALAISVVLVQFGAAIGMSVGAPMLNETTASWNVVIAGLWVLLVAIISATAGGYLTGRMRVPVAGSTNDEREFRDGAHGLTVWAVSTVGATAAAAVVAALTAAGEANATTLSEIAARFAANSATIFAFSTAAAAVIGAGAAWWAAVAGGNHRDQSLSVHEVVPAIFRRRRR